MHTFNRAFLLPSTHQYRYPSLSWGSYIFVHVFFVMYKGSFLAVLDLSPLFLQRSVKGGIICVRAPLTLVCWEITDFIIIIKRFKHLHLNLSLLKVQFIVTITSSQSIYAKGFCRQRHRCRDCSLLSETKLYLSFSQPSQAVRRIHSKCSWAQVQRFLCRINSVATQLQLRSLPTFDALRRLSQATFMLVPSLLDSTYYIL